MRSTKTACFALTLALGACANNATEIPLPIPTVASRPLAALPPGTPRLLSSPLAQVSAGTFGPYLGMGPSGGVAVWASNDGEARSWFARALSAQGTANAAAVRLGDAPSELGLVTVRPDRDGFALLSTHKVSDGEVVELSLLSASGARAASPSTIAHANGSLLWVEAIPNAHGASILWAASSAGRADIWTVETDAKAELVGQARLLSRDAGAWQAVPFGKGFALGVAHVGKSSAAHGPIDLTLAGDSGSAAPLVVNADASADLDLDLSVFGDKHDQLVLAWSDHRGGENRVFSCAVDQAGKIVAPAAPATPPLGEQAVLRIVPPSEGSGHAYLTWEAMDAQSASHRTFQVAEIQANGRVSSLRGLFEYWRMDGSVPEVAASPRGVAVLTLAPVCQRNAECTRDSLIAPELVEFDRDLRVTSTEPVWLEGAKAPASLAWNLSCGKSACFSLNAESGHEAAVSVARLEHRSDTYRAPAERVELPPPPRIIAEEALAETEPLAQIAFTETSAGSLLGWITDFDPTTPWVKLKKPTADGRFEPLRARIDLQAFGAGDPFAALAGAENLSLRAHSLGGISLAAGDKKDDVLTAWAGLDNGQPQVFLTLVDKLGKKSAQRMLTHKTGELSDIATLTLGADFLVAWVDERSSDPEVYATKVNHALNRIAPEQRITQALGAATDVTLVPAPTGALLLWADARNSEVPGAADIYAVALRANDASRVAVELPVQRTRAHSFSPVAHEHGKTTLVAWLEAAGEAAGEPAHVSFAELDDSAHVQGNVQTVALPAGNPLTLGLDCDASACHAIVSVDDESHGVLYAVTYRDGKATPAVKVRSTAAAPSGVAPVVHGREVFVADTLQGRGHVRRLILDW